MKLIEFEEQTLIIAENQSEYLNLPAHLVKDESGTIIFCWKLSFLERIKLLITGRIWHSVLSFGGSLQPQLLQLEKPKMEIRK